MAVAGAKVEKSTDARDASARLAEVMARIEAARKSAEKPAKKTTLVAVSKTFPADAIRSVIEAGQRVFGENRVQEAKEKWPALKKDCPDISLHLIGPLQSNKTRDAMTLFDVIESVDREKIAKAIAAERDRTGTCPRLLVQVNTGEEPQKTGIPPSETVKFVSYCRDTLHLPVDGLMCIPPVDEEPGLHFALLDKLANEAGVAERSMGMSADYETAIRFGATLVRVGSAIFGPRLAKKTS